MAITVNLVDSIDYTEVYKKLEHEASGAICVFVGVVRNVSKDNTVKALEFEAYKTMALKEMEQIGKEAFEKWNLNKVVIEHVLGYKKVTDPVVIVGVSCMHRQESFEACQFIIDTLKMRVPIWKKEYLKNKTIWVSAHP